MKRQNEIDNRIVTEQVEIKTVNMLKENIVKKKRNSEKISGPRELFQDTIDNIIQKKRKIGIKVLKVSGKK